MAIEFECHDCGRVLRVKDEHAGRRIKCPGCSAPLRVPQDDAGEDPFDAGYFDDEGDGEDDYGFAPPPRRPKAPTKRKKKTKVQSPRRRSLDDVPSRHRSSGGDGDLSGVDWLLIIFCGGISCIVGIVACLSGDSDRGVKMILYPFLIGIVLNVIMAIVAGLGNAL